MATLYHDEQLEARHFLVFRDVARSTDARTVIATLCPGLAPVFTMRVVFSDVGACYLAALLANLNSFVLDYIARQKLGGIHLSDYVTEQLPILTPSDYAGARGWTQGEALLEWIGRRVLELVYVNQDLAPFALEFGMQEPPHAWDEEHRFLLRCELDAAFFHLYGLSRDEATYVLDTFQSFGGRTRPRSASTEPPASCWRRLIR